MSLEYLISMILNSNFIIEDDKVYFTDINHGDSFFETSTNKTYIYLNNKLMEMAHGN